MRRVVMHREALHREAGRREAMRRKSVHQSAIDPNRAKIGALGVAAWLLVGIWVLALQAAASSAIAGKLPPSNISEPDFSRSGYGFSQFRFSAGGRTDFYGHGQSGAVIIVTLADRVIGQGAVDATGKWHISMAPAKPVWQARQEVHLQLLAFEPQAARTGTVAGNDLQMVDDVRLTVPSQVPTLASPMQPRAKSRLAVQSNTGRRLAAYPPLPTRRARAAVAAGAIYGRTASSSSDQVSAAGKVQPAKQPVAAQISRELSNYGRALEQEQAGSVLKRASSMIVTASSAFGRAATDLSAPRGDRSFIPQNVQFAAGQSSDGSAGAASQRSQVGRAKDQISPSRAPIILAQVTGASGGDVMDTLQKWYKQSEVDYRDVIRKLAEGGAQKGERRRQADRGADASKQGNGGERRTTSGLQRLLESVLPSDWWKRMRDGTRVAGEKPAKKRAGEGNGRAGPLSLKGAETAAKDEDKARETRAKELALSKQRDELAAARTERERQQQRLQKQRQDQQRQDQQRLADAARLAKKEAALEKAAAVARAAAQGAQQRKEKAAELARLKQEQLKEDQLKEERRRQLAAAAQDAKEQTAKARALEEAQAEAAAQKTRENLKAERAAERARMLAQRQAKERRARAELNRRVAEQKREFAAQQKAAALKTAKARAAKEQANKEQAAREQAAREQAVREKELALEQARIETQRQARLEAEKNATADARARELAAQRRKDELASRQAEAAEAAQAQAQAQADAAANTKRQSTIAAAALAAKQAVDQKRKPAGQSANEGEKPAADESLGSKVKRKFAFSIKEAKEAAAAALGAARAKIAKENRQKTREQRLALSLPTRRQADQGSRAGSDDGGGAKVGDDSAAGASRRGRRQTAEQVEPQRSQRLAQKSTARKSTALDAAAASDRGATRSKNKRSCKNAGLQIDLPGWYVVRRGDTLRTIARQHYRSSRARRLIYRANEDRIDDLKNLRPCTRMRLPLPEPAG